jgi:hypothetical protein
VKTLRTRLLLLALAAWLTGCASVQQPVVLDESLWSERDETIGVAILETPEPSVEMIGNQGLLDVAINTSLAAGLRSKVKTWDLSSFEAVPQQVVDELNKRGYQAKLLEQPIKLSQLRETKAKPGYATRDYSALKQQQQIDKLIVFSLQVAGTVRSYYAMVPTSDPISQVGALSQVIDLDDNRLLYHQPFAQNRAADGEWDEGPDYPNLTNAFYQVLDSTEQQLIAPFRSPLLSAQ